MRKILNYLLIFIVTIMILYFTFVIMAKIPRSAIEENIKESVEFYKKRSGIYIIKNKRIYSYIHYYADTRKLNILYNMDSNNTFESVLWSKYSHNVKTDSNRDFIEVVEGTKKINSNYLRYWNGVILVLRPLLVVFNMEQIYLINMILLAILTIVLFIMLLKKSKKIALIFLIALIATACWYVPMCIEYSVTFYVFLITSIIALKIEEKSNNEQKNDRLMKLFLITGIFTCFFDYLTTEILTLFVPVILILMIRNEEKKLDSLKETFKLVTKLSVMWFCGYGGTWLAKWILASLVLHINAFKFVKEHLFLRINGLQGLNTHEELYRHVIERNFYGIPLMNILHVKIYLVGLKIVIAVFLIIILACIDWKGLKNKKNLLLLFFIGIVPYIRYLVLANHSYRHAMFTFRDQIITIMILLYIIIDCLNYKVLNKKIGFKRLNKKT